MTNLFRNGCEPIILMALLFAGIVTVHSVAISPAPVYAPDQQQPGDPDVSQVLDRKLKELYLSTTVAMRTLGWDRYRYDLVRHKDTELYQFMRGGPRRGSEIGTIVSGGMAAFKETPVNWSAYRAALWTTRVGFYEDSSFVPVARAALEFPRGEKISEAHGLAIRETLECLATYSTPQSTALLLECTSSEFWQSAGPIRSTVFHRDPELSEISLRRLSVNKLVSFTDPHLVLPALASLIPLYPNLGPGRASIDSKGVTVINTLPEGFGWKLEQHLKHLKQREGLAPE